MEILSARSEIRQTRRKLAIHGTPITPKHLLPSLRGKSFCVSYYRPEQLDDCIDLVGRDGMLLLDNGAFSAWRQGLDMGGDYWDRFYTWAAAALHRCPQAVAVVPDVIDGDLAENIRHVESCPLPPDRVMPIWHLHEPRWYLARLCATFRFVGLGSSGEFAEPGSPAWKARMAQAVATIAHVEQATGRRPWVHMMRGLGLLHLWCWDSADSTNVARNHCRYKARDGDLRAVVMADRIERKAST